MVNPVEVFMQGGMMIEEYPAITRHRCCWRDSFWYTVTRYRKSDRVIAIAKGNRTNLSLAADGRLPTWPFSDPGVRQGRSACVSIA